MRPRVSPAARRVVATMLVAAIALEGIPLMRSQAGNRLVEEVVLCPAGFKVVGRAANVRRVRMVWRQRMQQIGTESQFRLRYKISNGRFHEIADTIRPDVHASNARKAMASSGGLISAELRLSMALRYMAGGHYVDIADMHGVSTQEVHKFLKLVNRAISKHHTALHMSMPRPDDTKALERLAVEFFYDNGKVIYGCIGCVDGVVVATEEPRWGEVENKQDMRNRKCYGVLGYM